MATGERKGILARPGFWLAAALVVVGILLRCMRLGYTYLWIDEITAINFARQQESIGSIISFIFHSNLRTGDTGQHMPAMFSLAHIALGLEKAFGGFSHETWMRIPFVLLSILTLPFFGLAVRRLYGNGAGMWALALLSISYFHVFQGRDATSYAPLVFFASVALWAMVELWANPGGTGRKFALSGTLFAGTLLMMGSHLTGWFLAFAMGAVAAGALAWLVIRKVATVRDAFNRMGWILLPLVLAALPFLQLVPAVIASTDNKVADVAQEHVTPALLFYQVAHFGWGQEAGRATTFLIVAALGIAAACAGRKHRGPGLAHVVIFIIPTVIFFLALHRDFSPRYVGMSFLPWLAFAAVGLDAIGQQLAGRIKVPHVQLVYTGAVAVLLAFWHAEPYRLLYNLTDKFMPVKPAHDWLSATVPEGGLYVWRNGYHLREIPGAYPLPGRSIAGSDYPNSWVTPELYQARSDMARNVFERFPLAGFIEDPDYDPVMWAWMKPMFAHRQKFQLETLDRLYELGFSPHGVKARHSRVLIGCWNTLDDVRQRSKADRRIVVLPTGKGWQYWQNPAWPNSPQQDARVFLLPRQPDAELVLLNGAGLKGTFTVKLTGMGVAPGYVGVKLGAGATMKTFSPTPNQPFAVEAGTVTLDGSDGRIFLSEGGREGVSALIHSIEIAAAAPAAGGT